ETIVVENAPLGVQSGKAAGCFVIAVNTGPLPDEVLLQSGADVIFHDMDTVRADLEPCLLERSE
ncbi:MAG: beta-phosphoglucomutase, partial [Prevotella sp.]